VNKLTKPADPTTEPAVLRLTGTDGGSVRERQGAATGAADGGSGRVWLRIGEETAGPQSDESETKKPLNSQGFEDSREQSRTSEAERTGRQLIFLSMAFGAGRPE
jgi:hypothetical protein